MQQSHIIGNWLLSVYDPSILLNFSINELESIKLPFGLKIERDMYFEPMKAKDVWDKLNRGEHV